MLTSPILIIAERLVFQVGLLCMPLFVQHSRRARVAHARLSSSARHGRGGAFVAAAARATVERHVRPMQSIPIDALDACRLCRLLSLRRDLSQEEKSRDALENAHDGRRRRQRVVERAAVSRDDGKTKKRRVG